MTDSVHVNQFDDRVKAPIRDFFDGRMDLGIEELRDLGIREFQF